MALRHGTFHSKLPISWQAWQGIVHLAECNSRMQQPERVDTAGGRAPRLTLKIMPGRTGASHLAVSW